MKISGVNIAKNGEAGGEINATGLQEIERGYLQRGRHGWRCFSYSPNIVTGWCKNKKEALTEFAKRLEV